MKNLLNLVSSYFSSPLPVGIAEFNEWSDSILSMSKVPDNDSTRFAVAVMILHLDPDVDAVPKREMVRRLNKSAANEVANAIATNLKEKQKAAAKLAAEIAIETIKGSNETGASDERMEQVERL